MLLIVYTCTIQVYNSHTVCVHWSSVEFLSGCSDIYRELELTKQNSHEPVVVPTSEESTPRVHDDEASRRPDGVDSMTLMRALIPLVEKLGPLWVQRILLYNLAPHRIHWSSVHLSRLWAFNATNYLYCGDILMVCWSIHVQSATGRCAAWHSIECRASDVLRSTDGSSKEWSPQPTIRLVLLVLGSFLIFNARRQIWSELWVI